MIYGIDFGTTCSSICQMVDNRPQPLRIPQIDSIILKSCISRVGNELYPGMYIADSNEFIISPKRRLSMQDGDSVKHCYTLLRCLRRATQQEQIDAVVTIPVYFNHSQREAMMYACSQAGINVIRLISEPIAIAFNLESNTNNKIIIDIGGGTTDISVLEHDHSENMYQVITTGGDPNFGGDDVSSMIYKKLLAEYPSLCIENPDFQTYTKSYIHIEHMKRLVSSTTNTVIHFQNIEISQAQFIEWCRPFYETILHLLQQVLDRTPKDMHFDIILAGGCSSLVGLSRFLHRMLPQYSFVLPEEPSLLVSKGACLYAFSLSNNIMESTTTSTIILVDSVPLSIGVQMKDDEFAPIIKKDTPVPVRLTKYFTTTEDDQHQIHLCFYQGEAKLCIHNHFIGEMTLTLHESFKRNIPRIAITMVLDHNHLLTIHVHETRSQSTPVTHVFTKDQLHLSEKQIKQLIHDAEISLQHDEMKIKQHLLLHNAYTILSYMSVIKHTEEMNREIQLLELFIQQCNHDLRHINNVSAESFRALEQHQQFLSKKYPMILLSNDAIDCYYKNIF